MKKDKNNTQTSLAGRGLNEEEKLWQAKMRKTRTKYRLISFVLVAVIVVSVLIFLLVDQKCLVFGHDWDPATCTTAKTCKNCSAEEGRPLGHDWEAATCTTARICTQCSKETGEERGHDWQEATCTTAKTCKECAATEGAPLGHNWMAATCTEPRICLLCAETDGAAAGHIWQAATCTEAQTCTSCGMIQGSALGHEWQEATFQKPKTCLHCNAFEGAHIPYEHIDVESEVLGIRDAYNDIISDRDNGLLREVKLGTGVTGYYDAAGTLRSVVVYRGTEGIGQESSKYSRSYYYRDGELFFAFFEGSDSHRLYFYDGLLMRWLYRSNAGSEYHDFDFTGRYMELEQMAKEESGIYQ